MANPERLNTPRDIAAPGRQHEVPQLGSAPLTKSVQSTSELVATPLDLARKVTTNAKPMAAMAKLLFLRV